MVRVIYTVGTETTVSYAKALELKDELRKPLIRSYEKIDDKPAPSELDIRLYNARMKKYGFTK